MDHEADLTAAVYDPPSPGLRPCCSTARAPVAVRPAASIDAGAAALARLIGEMAGEAAEGGAAARAARLCPAPRRR